MLTMLTTMLIKGYYAAITNVDDQVGKLLDALVANGVDDDTVVVLTADHGQNLGEMNMWSMMNLLETSLRVPLLIRPARSAATSRGASSGSAPEHAGRVGSAGAAAFRALHSGNVAVYSHPVESLDIFPTVVALAGLPAPPAAMQLAGTSLVAGTC